MKIDEFYSLQADTHCVTLHYEAQSGVNEKTGLPVISKRQSYFGNVQDALKKYVDECVASGVTPNSDVKTILSKLEEIKSTIDSIPLEKADLC